MYIRVSICKYESVRYLQTEYRYFPEVDRAAEKILYMTFQNKRTARQRKYICNKNLKNTGTTVKIDPYEFSLSKRGVVACTL